MQRRCGWLPGRAIDGGRIAIWECQHNKPREVVVWLLGATLGPILAESFYLSYSQTCTKSFSGDFIALVVSIVVGVICMQFLGNQIGWFRGKPWVNAMVLLLYVCVAAAFLFVYMFAYVCAAFGACL